MATITTTTNATPLIWPSTTLVDRDPTTGNLYVMVKASTADTYEIWRSVNNGGAWTLLVSTVRASIVEIGSIFVHDEGWLYWTYRTNEAAQDRIWFRRCNLGAASWQAELMVANPANGVHAGGMDIAVVRTPAQGHYVAIGCGLNVGASIGLQLYGVYINPTNGQPAVNHGIITGNRQWLATGAGRVTPSLDIEHVGNAHGSNTPHLWLAWGRTDLYAAKCAWTGAGWSGPTTPVKLNTATLAPAQDSIAGRWDGNRWVVAVPNPASTSTVVVYERNRANSTTTVRTTPVHTTGVVRNCALSYNTVTGDIRVYAVGTTTAVLYSVDYVRATGVWSAWVVVAATAILGATGNNYSVRRSSYGNAKYDVLTAHSGAPNTIVHTQQSLSYAPSAPTWDTAAMGMNSGSAADVAATRLLDWVFVDPDVADTQSAYAVSRQVGAGALSYWRASDLTWQPAEVKNLSATSSITLAAAWALAADAAYTFKAKVWDSADIASVYSDGFVVIPSAKVNPTINTPTAAQVLTTDTVTPSWTVAEQTQYRLTLATNPGGVVAFDSGWVASSATSVLIPLRLADLSGWTITLQTRNLEGLPSNVVTVNFSIDYVEPAVPATSAVPVSGAGVINVTVTNPAPAGGQPALADQDIYRRPIAGPNLLTNPGFEADTVGWTSISGTFARSSAQAHEGAWSALLTPDGVGTPSRIESSAVALVAAVEGQLFTVDGWIRPTTANKPVQLAINWFTAAGAFIVSSSVSVPALAGVWMYLSLTAAGVATTGKAGARMGLTTTPAATDTAHIDDMRLRVADVSDGVRVAAGVLSGAVLTDWGPIHGVAYEYRVLARGINGTSIYGPWAA